MDTPLTAFGTENFSELSYYQADSRSKVIATPSLAGFGLYTVIKRSSDSTQHAPYCEIWAAALALAKSTPEKPFINYKMTMPVNHSCRVIHNFFDGFMVIGQQSNDSPEKTILYKKVEPTDSTNNNGANAQDNLVLTRMLLANGQTFFLSVGGRDFN